MRMHEVDLRTWEREDIPKDRLAYILFFLAMICFTFFLCQTKITKMHSYQAVYLKEDTFQVLVPIQELPTVITKRRLRVGKEEYHYQPLEIKEEILLGSTGYQKEVVLKIDLPPRYYQENMMLEFALEDTPRSILQILWEGLGKNETDD